MAKLDSLTVHVGRRWWVMPSIKLAMVVDRVVPSQWREAFVDWFTRFVLKHGVWVR